MRAQRNILLIVVLISLFANLAYGLEGIKQVEAYEYQIDRQTAQLQDRDEQIEIMDMLLDQRVEPEIKAQRKYAGEFEITYYTAGRESTGKSPGDEAYGITKSGTNVQEGQTIAADWGVLPEGTKVFIEGVGERVVEDTGSVIKGNTIDVYVEDVEFALELGRHKADVYVVEEVKE